MGESRVEVIGIFIDRLVAKITRQQLVTRFHKEGLEGFPPASIEEIELIGCDLTYILWEIFC